MKILIVGAGIIGLTTAYQLLKRGHHVRLVDREEAPGRVSSYMNGGQFSYTYAEPLASPAMLRQLLPLLLGRHRSLQFHRCAFPEVMPWGMRFLGNCTSAKYRENTRSVLNLARLSRSEMGRYLSGQGAAFDFRQTGKLHLYRDPSLLHRTKSMVAMKNSLGFGQEIWDEARCRAEEPALAEYRGSLAGGVFSPLDQSGDSYKLIEGLRRQCLDSGRCELLTGLAVEDFKPGRDLIQGVCVKGRELHADAYLLCAGAESPRLLKALGVNLPIIPVKGYSITVPALPGAPEINLTDTHHKIVFTRLGDRLRVAGLMEFAGWDRRISDAQIKRLLHLARQLLPLAGDYTKLQASWAGLRPMTPDGVPVIGPTRWGNFWLNIGHGMLGSTLALGSARLIADLIDGCDAPLETDRFYARRFYQYQI
ncbi:MAG: D-amino acid dehydrogenase [Chromatiales bacterium]|jgi:D-amino-acid dehydrogenase